MSPSSKVKMSLFETKNWRTKNDARRIDNYEPTRVATAKSDGKTFSETNETNRNPQVIRIKRAPNN